MFCETMSHVGPLKVKAFKIPITLENAGLCSLTVVAGIPMHLSSEDAFANINTCNMHRKQIFVLFLFCKGVIHSSEKNKNQLTLFLFLKTKKISKEDGAKGTVPWTMPGGLHAGDIIR